MAFQQTFYISHGSPALSIDDSLPARPFLQSFKDKVLSQKPKSILIISAHWETDEPAVNCIQGTNDLIYDFYGFPQRMYKIKYPAPGAPELANKVKDLLEASGVTRVQVDKKRGLDHGAWVPMMLMYPEADIPVCQLSVQTERDGTYHYNIGKVLAPLKQDGVLIVGSGSATHNLRQRGDMQGAPASWALNFDNWLKDALLNGRYEDVNHYEQKAPSAKVAHPWPEHFYPLHVAMGASGMDAKAELIHHSWTGNISYASYKFEEKAK